MLPVELLQILACPICKGELIQREDGASLFCNHCSREYPVVDGIPILLPKPADKVLPAKGGTP